MARSPSSDLDVNPVAAALYRLFSPADQNRHEIPAALSESKLKPAAGIDPRFIHALAVQDHFPGEIAVAILAGKLFPVRSDEIRFAGVEIYRQGPPARGSVVA